MNRNQLLAIRATLAALAAQVDALDEDGGREHMTQEPPEETTDECQHRHKDRGVATFGDGADRWRCRDCGFIGGEKAAEE